MSATCDACKKNVERAIVAANTDGAGPTLCFGCVSQYAQCVQAACETVIAAEVPRARHITRNNARRNLQ